MISLHSLALVPAAIVTTMIALPGASNAQVADMENAYVATEEGGVLLRCAPGSAYYAVAELGPDAVLIADGETETGWLRVHYPAGTPAYVPAAAGDPQGETLVLGRDESLRALHLTSGFAASWNKLLSTPIEAGRSLPLIETISSNDSVMGYIVEAPAEARGFLRRNQTRTATQDEINRFLGIAEPEVTEPETEPPGEPVAEPAPDESAADDAPADPASDLPPPGEVSTQPESADAPAEQPADQPSAEPGAEAEPEQPAEGAPVERERGPVRVIPRPENREPAPFPAAEGTPAAAAPATSEPSPAEPVATIEELERAFVRVQKQSTLEAELAELRHEIERTMADEGTEPEVRDQLATRAEILRIREILQSELRLAAESERKADLRIERFGQRMAALQAEREYTIVGRIATSGVYDGDDLPLLYRILDPSSPNGPTIAYLKPQDNSEGRFVGQLVGIFGQSRVDPRMGIRVVTADSVERISEDGN